MCFGAREDSEAKRSREIDAMIHRDEKVMQKVVKLLLLGKPSKHSNFRSRINPKDQKANHGYRCWREWQIDDIEANAIDIHKGWLHQEREGGMASHHIQQYPRRLADDDRCYGGVRHSLRVRKYGSAYSFFPADPAGLRRASLTTPDPSPSHYARERPPTLRTHPNRISARFQGHVEGSGNKKGGS